MSGGVLHWPTTPSRSYFFDDDDNNDEVFASVFNNKAKNQLPATKDVEAAVNSGESDYDEFDGDIHDDARICEDELDNFNEPEVYDKDDDGVCVRLFDDDDN